MVLNSLGIDITHCKPLQRPASKRKTCVLKDDMIKEIKKF